MLSKVVIPPLELSVIPVPVEEGLMPNTVGLVPVPVPVPVAVPVLVLGVVDGVPTVL